MGRVMDVAFFHGAEDCGMKAALAALEMEQENPGCCDDDSFTLTGQDDLIKVSWDDLDFEQQVFLQTYTVAYLHLLSVVLEEVATPLIEAPPLPERKLHQLYEVYLI
ncbi:hypothetical protein BUL40_10205 [Croceivirga radicis]|uniref:Uncharacterized protein n=2 Tax=Croceivirga radicis TaxID=1929488 RepID=A0A1V6LRL5_9FLAO|nr:hypothetical protein BUL40_10205 [Croceivirga radicis]